MRKKVHNLGFIPVAVPFTDLSPGQEESMGYTEDDSMIEIQICQMIHSLTSDKQRCVFMFLLLREHGFNFDHASCAKSLGVEWRWYMRVKAQVQKKLREFSLTD